MPHDPALRPRTVHAVLSALQIDRFPVDFRYLDRESLGDLDRFCQLLNNQLQDATHADALPVPSRAIASPTATAHFALPLLTPIDPACYYIDLTVLPWPEVFEIERITSQLQYAVKCVYDTVVASDDWIPPDDPSILHDTTSPTKPRDNPTADDPAICPRAALALLRTLGLARHSIEFRSLDPEQLDELVQLTALLRKQVHIAVWPGKPTEITTTLPDRVSFFTRTARSGPPMDDRDPTPDRDDEPTQTP